MKTLKLDDCCSLIEQLTKFNDENPGEKLRLILDGFVYSAENALGLMDTIEFWSKKIDMCIDLRFTNTHYSLIVAAGLPLDKIRIGKSTAILFHRPRHMGYGTLTDIKVSTTAAKEIEDQTNAILVAHYGFELSNVDKWLDESAVLKSDKIIGYGVQLIPGAI